MVVLIVIEILCNLFHHICCEIDPIRSQLCHVTAFLKWEHDWIIILLRYNNVCFHNYLWKVFSIYKYIHPCKSVDVVIYICPQFQRWFSWYIAWYYISYTPYTSMDVITYPCPDSRGTRDMVDIKIMHELPWTTTTTFASRVRRFANDFHEWRSHEWKSSANRLTSDPQIVIHGNECIN